ncbi:hypothetical protein KJI95_04285 [Shewanella sp. JM162201]|uniref:DUF998 domain-containing protein n=1 Tax=Shewanella jiangmenensis TaxID=2837387 RepID=A0ABS5UZV4_9GAMM|nr:hypothetical protein [Shewanella jiangmenensis]MBT1443744.1 hypothetical protein [Shewanella jiangmenensis]
MSDEQRTDFSEFDPHRLVFHMSIGGVMICAFGMSLSILAVLGDIGWQIINLRIDRLGDYLSSPLAYVYNICLLFAGASFVIAMLGLFSLRYNSFSRYIAIIGGCTGLSIMLLGIYPFNDPESHRLAAVFFLFCSLAMFLMLALTRRNHRELCSAPLCLTALMGLISCIGLLMQLDLNTLDYRPCGELTEFCPVAFAMWIHTSATMLAGIGLALMARTLMHRAIAERAPSTDLLR